MCVGGIRGLQCSPTKHTREGKRKGTQGLDLGIQPSIMNCQEQRTNFALTSWCCCCLLSSSSCLCLENLCEVTPRAATGKQLPGHCSRHHHQQRLLPGWHSILVVVGWGNLLGLASSVPSSVLMKACNVNTSFNVHSHMLHYVQTSGGML